MHLPYSAIADLNPQEPQLTVNGQSTDIEGFSFEGAAKVKYGDIVTFGVNIGTGPYFYYLAEEDVTDTSDLIGADWNAFSVDNTNTTAIRLTPGNYFLGFSSTVDAVLNDYIEGNFGITVERATFETPTDLAWENGTKATWTASQKTTTGGTVDTGAVDHYVVKLYKNDSLIKTVSVTDAAEGYDFSAQMTDEGVYAFTVQAIPTNGASNTYYLESAVSAKKANRVVKVTISFDSGVASVTPSTPFMVTVGKADAGTYAIQAVLKSGRTFGGWRATETGVSFADASALATYLLLDDNYTGATSITVFAWTVDDIVPYVSYFGAANGDKAKTHLMATFTDSEDGVAGYYIGPEADPASVSAWTSVSEGVGEFTAAEYQLTAGGIYYLHVKDKSGNIITLTTYVTEMRYHDFCISGELYDFTEYFISSSSTEKYVILKPSRIGFELDRMSSQPEGSMIPGTYPDTIPHSTELGYDIYVIWNRLPIEVSKDPEDLSFTYDGKLHTLSITVDNTEGDIAYQWYRNGAAITGATEASYKVKNVADSGNYYVVVTLTVEGEPATYQCETVAVSIAQRPLTLTAHDYTVVYKDAAPSYELSAAGFAEGEGLSDITVGTLQCAYIPGDAANGTVGTYPITFNNFASDNYSIQYHPGTLTVDPYDVNRADTTVTVTLPANVFPYTGEAIVPVPVILDGETPMPTASYQLSYENNTQVGTATLTVAFSGNYTGTVEKTYLIERAEYSSEVSLTGWTFGDPGNTPSVSQNPENGTVTYYYRLATEGRAQATAVKPVNAGSYLVYAVIDETENYQSYTTQDVAFEIAKKSIEIIADSHTWEFDGFEHAAPDYTVVGAFVGSDSLRTVTVTTSITNVGSVENVISDYQLSSSTIAGNYDIVLTPGTLTVTAKTLTPPSNIAWSAEGGIATWVRVTKEGLTVEYTVDLYRYTAEGEYIPLTEITTQENFCDFTDVILADCAANGAVGSYAVKVLTAPVGGINQANYTASGFSDYSPLIHTVYVIMEPVLGLSQALIEGQVSLYMIAGQSADISATLKTGFSFNDTVWTTSSPLVVLTDATASVTTLTVLGSLSENIALLKVTPGIHNDRPVVEAFDAESSADYKSVIFTFAASDTLGITGWLLTTALSVTAETEGWNNIEAQSEFSDTQSVNTTGVYYLYVKDAHGNIVRSSSSIAVYSVAFGAGMGGSGSMDTLLKVQNKELILPDNTFINSGKQFKNWSGASGSYENGGIYTANQNDTLEAQWANSNYSYTARFFLMKADGTYAAAPDFTRTFAAAFNQVVAVTDDELLQAYEGMSLDTRSGYTSTITIDETGKSINVYYRRNTYTLTYRYRMPDASEYTVVEHQYLYGAVIEPLAKPTAETGYGFIGWTCTQTGSLPATMPASDLTASGTFGVYETRYIVNYFVENLEPGTGYTRLTNMTETLSAFHSRSITYSAEDAAAISGFTAAGVIMTEGAVGSSNPTSYNASATGRVDADAAKQLNVNIYYTRNSYNLTLYVWQGNRLEESLKYSYTWSVRYQTPLVESDYITYNQDTWEHDSNYQLAAYSDWSTGLGAPSTMPAGDVSVSRDFVSTVISSYEVEVYLEEVTEGLYTLEYTLLFYDNVDAVVTIGATDDYSVNFNNFGNAIEGFNRYQYDADNPNNVTSAVVTDVAYGEESAVLKVYFERRSYTATINYYSTNSTGTANMLIGTITKTARWGTYYTIEPMTFFDPITEAPEGYTNVLPSALAYDYRANKNVIMLSYYNCGTSQTSTYSSGSKRLDTAADLESTYQYRMPYTNNNCSVYYFTNDFSAQFYLDVYYRVSNTVKYKGEPDRPVTISVNGSDYPVRIVNKSYIFEYSTEPSDDPLYFNYPGAQEHFGTWLYGDLNEGFTEASYGSSTVYLKDGYAYVADETNQFIRGGYVSYNYNGKPGYDVITAFVTNYHTEAADVDDNAAGMYVSGTGYSGFIYNNGRLTVTFSYTSPWKIVYMVGGVACNGHQHSRGSKVNVIGCTHELFSEMPGFKLGWYYDPSYTRPVTPFVITQNYTLYGRYEKETVVNHDYIYYQLTEDIEVGGQKVGFITEDLLTNPAVASHITSSSSDEEWEFENGSGNTVMLTVTTTRYFYDGILVMICKDHPSLTFTNISLSVADYLENGFHYDDVNTQNTLITCCQDSAIALRAFFLRDTYDLTFNPDNSNLLTESAATYRFGATVELPEPEKPGYTFKGYSFKIWDAENYEFVPWTGDEVPTEGTFAMPEYTLYVTAQYDPAGFTQTIRHYFASVKNENLVSLLDDTLELTPTEVTATLNGADYTAKLYENNVVAIRIGDFEYFFSDSAEAEGKRLILEECLFAATEEAEFVSENNVGVGIHVSFDFDTNYSFSKCNYYYNMNNNTRLINQAYKAYQDMELTYYYTRNSYVLDLNAMATDHAAVGETLVTGDGTYPYGASRTVRVTVATGYTFVGWFDAADLEGGYNTSLTPLSTDATYSFTLLCATALTAVVEPNALATTLPAINSVSGSTAGASLVYGYTNGTDNLLNVSVSMPEDLEESTFITGYQWYEVVDGEATPIEGANISTYRVPTGKSVGEYTYRCEVLLAHSKNGRTGKALTEDFTVTVVPKPITYTNTNYSGNYDGNGHSFGLTVGHDAGLYTTYYSVTELTGENFDTGSTTKPTYRDVIVDADGNPTPHVVYFYIHSTDGNHQDATGSATVMLYPRSITLSATSLRFFKTYDATVLVPGSFTEEGSKMYELTHSAFYTINGLLPNDTVKGYLVSCEAVFNSKDVDFANAVILSDIQLVDADGENIYNYKFSDSYTLNVSAYINPRTVSSSWSTDTSFEYDGEVHAPVITIEPDALMQADGLTIEVTGKRSNVGTFLASTEISVSSEVSGARASNYCVEVSNKSYTINNRAITVKPVPDEVTYDGEPHTLTVFVFPSGTILDGSTYSVAADKSFTAAGTYTVMPKNLKIYDENHIDVTDSYSITYESATLTVQPKKIGISGITVQTKEYDGNTEAVLVFDEAELLGVVEGDTVGFDQAGITAFFPEAGVDSYTLVLAYAAGLLTGADAANYVLDADLRQANAAGEITKKALILKANDAAVTYGDDTVPFAFTATGFLAGEDQSLISGTASYLVRKHGTTDHWEPYSKTLPVGTYDILVAEDALSVDDYSMTVSSDYGTLTVGQKTLTLEGNQTEPLSKIYSGNTAVTQNIITNGLYKLNGIVNGDTVALASATAAYASKDVADSIVINVTGCTLNNANYKLANTSFTLEGAITKKNLTVTVDNKTTTYGSAAPAFTVSYSGFVGTAQDSISGTLVYSCAYDMADADNRGAGTYTVTASGLTSNNYNIIFKPGTLTVNKAVITVKAENASRVYRGAAVTYTSTMSGFKYTDDESVVSGSPALSGAATESSAAGTYEITVSVSGLSADNYTFIGSGGSLHITPAVLTVSGVIIYDKIYDNSTEVYSGQIDFYQVEYNGLLPQDMGHEGITLSNVQYADKNAANDVTVTFTVVLNAYLADRYTLSAETQTFTTSNITKRELKINLGTASIGYGTATPDYTAWNHQTYSNIAPGEVLANTGWNHSAFAVDCAYDLGTNDYVGTYTVSTSETDLPIGQNYYYTITDGSLTVAQKKLDPVAPGWSSSALGTLSWNDVSTYGSVGVSYQLSVLKNGADIGLTMDGITGPNPSVDLKDQLKALGAGVYTVKVVAAAGLDNNEDHVNVLSSDAVTSAPIYLTEVEFVFDTDATTVSGKTDDISIHSAASYIMIAGETDIPIKATIQNATGYSVKTLNISNTKLSGIGLLSGDTFTGSVSMNASNTSVTKATVTLTLKATAATLNNVLTGNPSTAQFSYKAAARPIITATPNPVNGDNVDASGYDYTYQWLLKSSAAGSYVEDTEQTTDTYLFPMGQNAYSNYRVRCVVTATRKDNGVSISQTKDIVVVISKADLTPTLDMDDWTFGEVRSNPVVSDNLGNGAVTYYYSAANDDSKPWTTQKPTEAGTYYVKMVIAQTANYAEYVMTSSMATEFTIHQAKLSTPAGIELDQRSGYVSWNPVSRISENGDPDSTVYADATYLITMTRDGNPYKTYTTEDSTYKVADDIDSVGQYDITVTAISTNPDNCLDSDATTDVCRSIISATIEATDTTHTFTGSEFVKEYDNDPIILTVTGAAEGATLCWYFNGYPISGATSDTYSVKNVQESGTYVVEITKDGVTHSTFCEVSITKKPLMIQLRDHTITYGDPFSHDGVTFTGFAPGESEANLTGSLVVDTSYEQYKPAKIYYMFPSGFVSKNYQIKFASGVLTVVPKEISVTASAGSKIYGAADPTLLYTVNGLVNGDTLSGTLERVAGENVGTYQINVGTLNNANYTITSYTPAIFTIQNATIADPVIKTNNLTYNGLNQNPIQSFTAATVNNQPITVMYSVVENGIYADSVGLKQADTYTIYYKINAANHNEKTGSFTATVNKKALTVTANPKTIVFGQVPVDADVTYSGFENGEDKTVLKNSLQYTFEYAQFGNVGTYAITPYGLTADNYAITFVPGVMTVTNATLTDVSAAQTGTLTYNAAPQTAFVSTAATAVHSLPVSFTYSAAADGTYTSTVPAFTAAGEHTVYYKASTANHDTVSGSFTVTIGQKALTVTAKDHTVTYGDNPANNGVEYSGFAGTDTQTVLGGTLAFNYTYSRFGDIGSYLIIPSGLTSSDYAITFDFGTLTVVPKHIKVTAEGKTKVYGTPDVPLTYIADGLVNGDTLSGALVRVEGEGVETYPILQGTLGADDHNYTISYDPALFAITKATLVDVTAAQSGSLTYNGLPQTATIATTATSVNDQAVIFTYSTEQNGAYAATVPAFTNADTYTVYYKANAANHNTVTGSFTVTVGKKAITVTAKPKTITYGDAPQNDGVDIVGLVNGETEAVLGGERTYTYNYVQYNNAGSYTITPPAYTSSNYVITFNTGVLTVAAKSITVTAKSDQSKIYGDADPTFTYDVTGLVNGDTLTGVLGRTAGETVGSYEILKGSLANPNYDITYISSVFRINKATLSGVGVSQKTALVYTGLDQVAEVNTAATAVNSQPVTFTYSTAEDGTYTTDVPAFRTAGNHTVYYIASAPNHNDSKGSFVVNIGQKTLTITAKNKTIIFGQDPDNAGYTYSGLAAGDSFENVVSGTVGYAYNYTKFGAVGNYTITPSGLSSEDYVLTYVPGVLTVANATLSDVSVTQNGTDIYTGAAHALAVLTAATAVHNETVTFTYSATETGEFGAMPTFMSVGTHRVYYKASAANHNDTFGYVDLTIGKAQLKVTANDHAISYGENNANNGVSYTGLVGDETSDVLDGTLSYTYTYEQYGDIGTYDIMPYGLLSDSYNITFAKGTLTVNAKSITVKAKAMSKIYAETDPVFTYEAEGLENGDTLHGVLSREPGENVGTYHILKNTLGAEDSNYTIVYQNDELFEIKPATIVIDNFDFMELIYNEEDQKAHAFVAATTRNGQPLTWMYSLDGVTYSIEAPQFKNAGIYTVYVQISAPNHETIVRTKNVEVERRAITVTPNDNTITYGDAPQANGAVITGLVPSSLDEAGLLEALSYTFNYTQYGNVGTYDIMAEGIDNSNYLVNYAKGKLTVQKRTAYVTVQPAEKIYGEADPVFTATTTNLVNGDTLGMGFGRAVGENVGSYNIALDYYNNDNYNVVVTGAQLTIKPAAITNVTVSQEHPVSYTGLDQVVAIVRSATTVRSEAYTFTFSLDEDGTYTETMPLLKNADTYTVFYKVTANNHNVYADSFEVTIDKALLTVTANDHTVTYGDAPENADVRFDGFVGGEDRNVLGNGLSFDYTYTAFDPVGTYDIIPSGYTSGNYAITFVKGTLTVQNADIQDVVITQKDMMTYTGELQEITTDRAATAINAQPLTYKFSLTETGTYTTDNVSLLHAGVTKVYYIVSAPNHNDYKGSFVSTIAKAPLTVKALDNTIIYGNEVTGSGVDFDGFLGTDTVESLGGALRYTSDFTRQKGVGTYVLTPSGYESEDYAIAYEDAVLTVDKRDLVIRANPSVITFGDEAKGNGVVFTGFASGENARSLTGGLYYGFGTYKTGAGTGTYTLRPYGFTSNNYNIMYLTSTMKVVNAELTDVSVEQAEDLIFNGEEQEPVLKTTGAAVLDKDITFRYAMSENSAYSTELPTFVEDGDYTVYYCASAENHNDFKGSFNVKVRIAELPENPSISDFDDITHVTRGLRIWLYDGVEKVEPTDAYPTREDEQALWGGVMNLRGFSATESVEFNSVSFEDEDPAFSLKPIARYEVVIKDGETVVKDFAGEYWICILLPVNMRSAESIWAQVRTANGAEEYVEIRVDGHYGIFKAEKPGTYTVYTNRGIINLWPFIIALTVLNIIAWIVTGVNNKKRRKLEKELKGQKANALVFPFSYMLGFLCIPKYGVEILIGLAVIFIVSVICMISAIRKRKRAEKESEKLEEAKGEVLE